MQLRNTVYSSELTIVPQMPANCGLFVGDRETSVRIGLHGGPERTRTSNQTIIRTFRFAAVPKSEAIGGAPRSITYHSANQAFPGSWSSS
jgi:hypothetical protein